MTFGRSTLAASHKATSEGLPFQAARCKMQRRSNGPSKKISEPVGLGLVHCYGASPQVGPNLAFPQSLLPAC